MGTGDCRGRAAIIFGLLAFVWRGLTLLTLVLFYGATRWQCHQGRYVGAALVAGDRRHRRHRHRRAHFLWPAITTLVLRFFIADWGSRSACVRRRLQRRPGVEEAARRQNAGDDAELRRDLIK
jgi:hypothetical protein